MRFSALIVAAGRGQRMGAGQNKLLLPLADEPVLSHTLRLFDDIPGVGEIILVIAKADEPQLLPIVRQRGTKCPLRLVYGGAERMDSVWQGLQVVTCPYVLVHDGARPLTPRRLILSLLERLQDADAVIPAIPVKDTVKQVDEQGFVVHTPAREHLRAAQTPQAFRTQVLREVYRRAMASGGRFTDDASVMEWAGYPVAVVPGDEENIKLTVPQDMILAEWIVKQRREADDAHRNRL